MSILNLTGEHLQLTFLVFTERSSKFNQLLSGTLMTSSQGKLTACVGLNKGLAENTARNRILLMPVAPTATTTLSQQNILYNSQSIALDASPLNGDII